ncbi:phage tail sheath family protein [Micromonospora carbonacea]|uniref:Phage tail sheath family protein n=1 Tax=Micromonospora carbonacea TaxID=47853 RepID=A0A7H8XU19_9ACTN|nr:phage tail sheath subtilisin-like domain-containing protein [Micromonospora carbonacea]MBB5830177.1 phage tail sheath protein FI [Micromonospora carbonacea]QLD27908.1 phage tail sheath family protein [Micromonospora carbonacea]
MPTYLSPGVYVEEVQSGSRPIEGVGTAVTAFLGFAEKGPFHAPTLVTNWSQYVQLFGGMVEGAYLAHAVYGYFANGGGVCYVVRIGDPSTGRTTGGRGGQKALPAGEPSALGTFRVAALPTGGGGEITVEVADVEGEGAGEDRFRLVVHRDGQVAEEYDGSFRRNSKTSVVSQVRERSHLITMEEVGPANGLARPANQTVALAPATAPGDAVPAALTAGEFAGDVDSRTGLAGLEAIDEITMVAAPDLMGAYQQGVVDLEAVKAAQLALISHCEQMGDRMALLDPPPELTAQQVRAWRQDEAGYDSRYAALYYPWVKVFDPSTGRAVFLPPSGHLAGLWSRNDTERGVHKAPANEVVRGVVDLQNNVTKGEQDLLNPIGVNCIRAFPGRGVRVWGARTLSSDPAWRYINVRRLFNYVEESILLGTQWVVFEPNDQRLWGTIRRNITAFLTEEWRRGALFGATAAEAFYVKCDQETNPPEVIDRGQVVCEIGICPVKPAEFVVFRLAQFSDSTSLVSD